MEVRARLDRSRSACASPVASLFAAFLAVEGANQIRHKSKSMTKTTIDLARAEARTTSEPGFRSEPGKGVVRVEVRAHLIRAPLRV